MKKMIISIIILISSIVSAQANAALIGPLPSNTYVTNNSLDWTWVSAVSHSGYCCGITIAGPETRSGWRYATLSELDYLDTILGLFFNNGAPIESSAYWQDGYTGVNPSNWLAGDISSGPGTYSSGEGYFELVYVRGGNLNAVPIPAAAFLFAPALLGFMGLRRKAKNSVI